MAKKLKKMIIKNNSKLNIYPGGMDAEGGRGAMLPSKNIIFGNFHN